MKMNKTFAVWAILLILATTSVASILTIRIIQDGSDTSWSINNRNVTMSEIEEVIVRLSSIESNQFLYIVAQSNVPSSKLVQTIGVVQRAGLHNIGLICTGTDGTNAGTWRVTLDAQKRHLPTCIADEHSLSGFEEDSLFDLRLPPEVSEAERQTEK